MVKPAPVNAFLFFGDDGLSKERAINNLVLSLLGGSSRELNLRVFHSDGADAKQVLDYLATVPFLAARRVAVVRDCEKWPEEDVSRLIEFIRRPVKTGCIILETQSSYIPRHYKGISRQVDVRRFVRLNDRELPGWLKQYAASCKVQIDEDAIRAFRELQIRERAVLSQEMDKLASFVGDNDTITGEDVEKVVGRALFSSAFDLVWAVGSGRTKAAVNMVSDLVSSGRKPHEIIGILCWHLRRVLKARMLKAGGSSDSNVVHDAGISEIYFDEFIRQVRHFDIPNIKSMMEVLLEADCDIKRTKFDPAIILDFAIMRLCLGRG